MDKSEEFSQIIAKKQRKLIISFFLLALLTGGINILTIESFWGELIFIFLTILYYALFISGVKEKSLLIIGIYIGISFIIIVLFLLILILVIVNKDLPRNDLKNNLNLFLYGILIAVLIILKLTTIIWSIQLFQLIKAEKRIQLEEPPTYEEYTTPIYNPLIYTPDPKSPPSGFV